MRSNTCTNSLASWVEVTMRSRSWHPMQLSSAFFWVSVPGKLASHSALVSCFARFRVGRSLISAVVGGPAAAAALFGASKAEPTGREGGGKEPGPGARGGGEGDCAGGRRAGAG